MDEPARHAARQRLAQRGWLAAWAQADAAGPMSPVEQAAFLFRRVYPGLPELQRQRILDDLARRAATGTWHGLQRPAPMDDRP
jgi:hypothetical protein